REDGGERAARTIAEPRGQVAQVEAVVPPPLRPVVGGVRGGAEVVGEGEVAGAAEVRGEGEVVPRSGARRAGAIDLARLEGAVRRADTRDGRAAGRSEERRVGRERGCRRV